MTKNEVLEQASAFKVDVVRLQFTDILGMVKNVTIPVKSLAMALDGGMMFDGSSIEGFVRIEESDMYLKPDPDTFAVLSSKPESGVTARLMCDIINPDGSPFAGCPRSVLKQVIRDAQALGYTVLVAPEPEFFLFEGSEARTTDEAGYFDLSPGDLGEEVRRDIVLAMESMGYEIEATHHEVSPGQHEIDFPYSDPLYCADTLMTFRVAARLVARQHGFQATFMPKPLAGVNGSGLHLHQRLMSAEGNAFYDPRQPNDVSRTALRYISGIMAHAPALTAITNPLINSYKRLVPGYEAPVYIAWSMGNRSPMVRVPRGRGVNTAVELRSPDPSCNPYLALAVTIRAGLDGLKHRHELSSPVSRNIYRLNEAERRELGIDRLPEDLEAALDALEADRVVWDALGDFIAQRFVEAKRLEWDVYRHEVHQWELDQYLRVY